MQKKKSGVKKCLETCAIKGGGWGVRRLMANAILNFHFDFPHPSLTKKLSGFEHFVFKGVTAPTDRPVTAGPSVRRKSVLGRNEPELEKVEPGPKFIGQFPYKSCQRSRTPRKVTGHQPAARARRPSTAAAKRPRTGADAGSP